MSNNLNKNTKLKRYGKASLTSSCPSNNNSQINPFTFTNNGLALNDENIVSNIRLTQSFDFSTIKRKNTDDENKSLKKKKQELHELIGQGHIDDITLLHKSTKNQIFKSFKVVIPEKYKVNESVRCRTWLIHTLGFDEQIVGNIVCYKHLTWKVGVFTDALSKLSTKLNITFDSPNKSSFLNNNTFFNQTQEQNNNNSTNLPITTNSRAANQDKFLLLRPTITTTFHDDDDIIDNRESPALFPTISSFSPSPLPPNQSPFFTSDISLFKGNGGNSISSGGYGGGGGIRQLPSPLDGLGHFLEKGLQLSDSNYIRTRSTRSRASSIEDIGHVSSTSSRSRAASRAAEPPVSVIMEGKCEDNTEEAEEEELRQCKVQPNQLVHFTNVTSKVNNLVAPTPLYSSSSSVFIQSHASTHGDGKNDIIQSTQTTVEIQDTQPSNDDEDFSDASTVLDDSFIIEDKVENEEIFYSFSDNKNITNDPSEQSQKYSTNTLINKVIVSEIPSFLTNACGSLSNNHHLPPSGLHGSSSQHISPYTSSNLHKHTTTATTAIAITGNNPNLKTGNISSPANLWISGIEKAVVKKSKPIIRAQTEPLMFVHHHHMSPGTGNEASYTASMLPQVTAPAKIHYQTPVASRPLDCVCNYLWEASRATSEISINQLLDRFNHLMLTHEEAPRIKRSISDPYSMSSYLSLHPAQGLMQISPHHLEPQQHVGGSNFYNNHLHNPFDLRNGNSFGSSNLLQRPRDGIIESPAVIARNAIRNRMSQSTGSILGTFGIESTSALLNISSPHINMSSSSSFSTSTHNNIVGDVPIFQHSEMFKSDAMMTTFTTNSSNEPNYESVRMQRKRIKSQAKLRRMSVCTRTIPVNNDLHTTHHLPSIAETKQQNNNSFNSFSPEPIAKCSKYRNQIRRKSTLFTQNNSGFINAIVINNMDDSHNDHSHSGIDDFDLSFGAHDNSTLDSHSNSDVKPHVIANPNLGSPIHIHTNEMNESNFKGVIIGGVYQHCFDASYPLVAAPAGSDKRVVDVKIKDDSSLVLSLYLPKDKTTKLIDLGIQWQWMRCSPTGYLAFRQSQQSFQVYYYLPKHPEDWKNEANNHYYSTTSIHPEQKRISLAKQQKRFSIIPNHEYKGGFNKFNDISEETAAQIDIEMDCQAFVEVVEASPSFLHHPIKHTEEDENDYYIMSHGDSYGDLNLSSNQIDLETNLLLDKSNIKDNVEEELNLTIIASSSEHWCNPNIMALILDFLIDDKALVGSIQTIQSQLTNTLENHTSSTKTRRKVLKKTEENMSVNSMNILNAIQLVSYQTVNKAWALGTYIVIANRKSSFLKNSIASFNYDRYISFINKFKDGKFLSQGACKDVYCIRNPITNSLEAISVMNINDLIARSMEAAVTQELQISLLCSSLITLQICPNLVQVYSLFQSTYNAPKNLWKTNKSIQDVKKGLVNKVTNAMIPREKDRGKYQFIRMEFCTGGDVEELVRKENILDIITIRSYLFQMCYALYACREKLCLRHFDIKLLNFFVTDSNSLLQQSSKLYDKENQPNTAAVNLSLQYGISNYIFKIPMQMNTLSLVKLADFGTSYVGAIGLGDFITMQQFTTLENTPPEFLLFGSRARQSYASDTFPLGLCFLHLLTGYEPYEELLKDIHCPSYLAKKLRSLWLTSDPNNQYYLLNEVIQSLDSECYEESFEQMHTNNANNTSSNVHKNKDILGPEMILIDTLYRYLVLFGSSDEFQLDSSSLHSFYHQSSPAWNIIIDALDVKNVVISNHNKHVNKHIKNKNHEDVVPVWNARGKIHQKQTIDHHQCIYQYKQDLSIWSIHKGKHPIMIDLRDRLASLGNDATKLLDSMLHFDPSRRSTMYDALLHPMFMSLRDNNCYNNNDNNNSNNDNNNSNSSMKTLKYMHYYRGSTIYNTNTTTTNHHCDLPIL